MQIDVFFLSEDVHPFFCPFFYPSPPTAVGCPFFLPVIREFFLPIVEKVLDHRGSYNCWGIVGSTLQYKAP